MFVSTLKELKLLSHSITLWQEPEGESREIIQAQCEDVNETSERLALRSNSSIKFTAKDVFFYCEAISLIFKTSGFDIEGDIISLDFPEEIVALDKEERREFAASLEDFDDSENTVVSGTTQHIKKAKTLAGTVAGTDTYSSGNLSGRVTTDKISTNVKASFKPDKISTVDTVINLDEDEQFAHKRAAPRARPSVDKKVTLHVQGRDSESKTFVLFDLSRGGLSFTISGKDLFQKNDLLEVTAFDDNPVDPPMIGIIRSVREEGMDEFRVGVQFTNED